MLDTWHTFFNLRGNPLHRPIRGRCCRIIAWRKRMHSTIGLLHFRLVSDHDLPEEERKCKRFQLFFWNSQFALHHVRVPFSTSAYMGFARNQNSYRREESLNHVAAIMARGRASSIHWPSSRPGVSTNVSLMPIFANV